MTSHTSLTKRILGWQWPYLAGEVGRRLSSKGCGVTSGMSSQSWLGYADQIEKTGLVILVSCLCVLSKMSPHCHSLRSRLQPIQLKLRGRACEWSTAYIGTPGSFCLFYTRVSTIVFTLQWCIRRASCVRVSSLLNLCVSNWEKGALFTKWVLKLEICNSILNYFFMLKKNNSYWLLGSKLTSKDTWKRMTYRGGTELCSLSCNQWGKKGRWHRVKNWNFIICSAHFLIHSHCFQTFSVVWSPLFLSVVGMW